MKYCIFPSTKDAKKVLPSCSLESRCQNSVEVTQSSSKRIKLQTESSSGSFKYLLFVLGRSTLFDTCSDVVTFSGLSEYRRRRIAGRSTLFGTCSDSENAVTFSGLSEYRRRRIADDIPMTAIVADNFH